MPDPRTTLALPDNFNFRNFNFMQQRVGFSNSASAFRKLILMMQMDPTEKGLILEILDRSHDPDLRLIYADWLDNHHRPHEAEAERQAANVLRHPPQPPSLIMSGFAQSG